MALVMEFALWWVMILQAVPVAMIDGTDFPELAGRLLLLQLQLRFFIMSALMDQGQVTPRSFC